jgi:hypothetical protein
MPRKESYVMQGMLARGVSERRCQDVTHFFPRLVHKFTPIVTKVIFSDISKIEMLDFGKKSFVPFA